MNNVLTSFECQEIVLAPLHDTELGIALGY